MCVAFIGCDSAVNEPVAAPTCLDEITTICDPLYLPTTFDNVLEKTLVPKCAIGGSSCHGVEGAKGGLVFDLSAPDDAWTALVEPPDIAPRVLPNDPACSSLIERLHSTDPVYQMPPGTPLTEPERCAVILWIANGGER